jgi:hypothetical protein
MDTGFYGSWKTGLEIGWGPFVRAANPLKDSCAPSFE